MATIQFNTKKLFFLKIFSLKNLYYKIIPLQKK